MRINPISTSTQFTGITSMDKKIPEELFGNKQKEFQALSDAKNLNVWALKSITGCMVNQQTGYMVLIQDDKNGVILKELKCNESEKEKKDLSDKLEQVLIWANAPSNISVAQQIQDSEYAKENPKHSQALQKVLYYSATSNEGKIWKERIDTIV